LIGAVIEHAAGSNDLITLDGKNFKMRHMNIQCKDDGYTVTSERDQSAHYETNHLDSAVYIAYHHISGNIEKVRNMVSLEKQYTKQMDDKSQFTNSYRLAVDKKDMAKQVVALDRYDNANFLQKQARCEMRSHTTGFLKSITATPNGVATK
jgi:hypothetical protein